MNKGELYTIEPAYENVSVRPIKLKKSSQGNVNKNKIKSVDFTSRGFQVGFEKQQYENPSTEPTCNSNLEETDEAICTNNSLRINENVILEDRVIITKGNYTKAELAHKEILRKRIRKQIELRASSTHRQRVSRFNEKLASLPEHFDIPKVGPG